MTPQLQKKVDFAIKLLQSIPTDESPVELSYSGGKDSDVILELAKMAGINYRAIYKLTTIDPPGTEKHARENGVEVLKPKRTFFDIVRAQAFPNRYRRFCCKELKEYKIGDRNIQGVRRAESTKRAKRYHEPEVCRLYPHGEKVKIYLPILEWTNNDVEEFIKERGIKCHPLYYDEQGNFHVERRLGCIGCPLVSDTGKADFVRYPKFFKQCLRAMQDYINSHPSGVIAKKYGDVYHFMFLHLFCNSFSEYQSFIGGGYVPRDRNRPEEVLGRIL